MLHELRVGLVRVALGSRNDREFVFRELQEASVICHRQRVKTPRDSELLLPGIGAEEDRHSPRNRKDRRVGIRGMSSTGNCRVRVESLSGAAESVVFRQVESQDGEGAVRTGANGQSHLWAKVPDLVCMTTFPYHLLAFRSSAHRIFSSMFMCQKSGGEGDLTAKMETESYGPRTTADGHKDGSTFG